MDFFPYCLLAALLTLQLASSHPTRDVSAQLEQPAIGPQLETKIRQKSKFKNVALLPVDVPTMPAVPVKTDTEQQTDEPANLPTKDIVEVKKEVPVEVPSSPEVATPKVEEQTAQELDHAGPDPENAVIPQETTALGRVKKQACVKVPCGNTVCTQPAQSVSQQSHQGLIIMSHDDPALVQVAPPPPMNAQTKPPKGARTVPIEPVYSFGPVSINGAGSGYGSNAYGSNHAFGSHAYNSGSYAGYAVKPYSSSSGASAITTQTSYAPTSNAYVMPVALVHQRQPVVQHSVTLTRPQVEVKPEIVYYSAPEPIYVEAEHHHHIVEDHQVQQAEPVSLYCHSLKSKELSKSLAPVEAKANLTAEDHEVNDHIKRVDEIKEEISQLNQAAQRIVDQQERLTRMQESHMVSAKNEPYDQMRQVDPYMMRSHTQMRIPPYGYGMYGGHHMPMYYKEAEEPARQASPPVVTAEESQKVEPTPEPKEEVTPPPPIVPAPQAARQPLVVASEVQMRQYPVPHGGNYRAEPVVASEAQMRQFPFNYGGGYYRTEPSYIPMYGYQAPAMSSVMQRSETGFPTAPLFFRSDNGYSPAAVPQEEFNLFMKFMDIGRKMGYMADGMKTPATKEPETKKENLLDDVINGAGQAMKQMKENEIADQPIKLEMDVPKQEGASSSKKDKRGLIQKKTFKS